MTEAPVQHELPSMSPPQLQIIGSIARCQDAEGAIRTGKSTAYMVKAWLYLQRYPGIQGFAARWKDQDVNGQLRTLFWEVAEWFPRSEWPQWDSSTESFVFACGSRLYMRSLRTSEESTRYSKFRGLTLAFVLLGQAEEIPEDYYVELKGRLSQPGYPHEIWLDANPVDEDHWIANHFPSDVNREGHEYITADIYSNRSVLGEEVIRGFEQDFPVGHPKRRTLLEGKRGVNVIGKPVYDGYFSLDLVKPVAFDPEFELYEGWDFGHSYPCVVWAQYDPMKDWLTVLGAVQGSDMFLEEFVPVVKSIRSEWFPHALISSWCDPSGESGNQGIKQTAMTTLHDFEIPVTAAEKANDPAVRDKAIQTIASLMFRKRFRLNPRCIEVKRRNGRMEHTETRLLVSAFSNGYVWDERKSLRSNPNIRSPKKGTRYDHSMNGIEYITTGAKLPSRAKPGDVQRAAKTHKSAIVRAAVSELKREHAALRKAQIDHDPDDLPTYRRPGRWASRGGY